MAGGDYHNGRQTANEGGHPSRMSQAGNGHTSSQSTARGGTAPSQVTGLPDTPNFNQPPEWERRCRDIWRRGQQAVQKPDGSADDWDVVHWLLTRRGADRAATVWPEIEEQRQAIEVMRREPLDLNRIRGEIIHEWEERERKEERRRYHKWLYRPRRQREQERKQRHQDKKEEAVKIAAATKAEGSETKDGGGHA